MTQYPKLARLSYGVVVTVKIYVIELPDKLKDVKHTMMLAHDIPMNHQPFWESILMHSKKESSFLSVGSVCMTGWMSE